MNVFTFGFPYSILLILGIFFIGCVTTTVVFGIIAFLVFIFGVHIGVIRVTPIFTFLSAILEFLWPEKMAATMKSIQDSFIVEYPEGEPERQPQIFLCHPHGIFSVGYFLNMGTRLTKWRNRPIKGTALSIFTKFPFGAEFFDILGLVPSDYDSMKNVLEDGESLGVCLGGVREILYTETNKMRLSILRKRGVFRMALEKGCPIVPVLTYGENELYQMIDTPFLKWMNGRLLAYGICVQVPTWESCRRWFGILEKPLAEPVRTVVGSAIPVAKRATPTDAEISELREKYFAALRDLYARTKPSHYADKLEIV